MNTVDFDQIVRVKLCSALHVFTDGYVQVSEDGSRLISPVLNTDSESCLEFSVRSEVNGSRMIRGITQLLDKQTLKKIKYEEQFIIRQTTEWKMIQFKVL